MIRSRGCDLMWKYCWIFPLAIERNTDNNANVSIITTWWFNFKINLDNWIIILVTIWWWLPRWLSCFTSSSLPSKFQNQTDLCVWMVLEGPDSIPHLPPWSRGCPTGGVGVESLVRISKDTWWLWYVGAFGRNFGRKYPKNWEKFWTKSLCFWCPPFENKSQHGESHRKILFCS